MIIFLDIDGVTHANSDDAIHFSCAPQLWSLLYRHPEARVVFSSGWRFTYSLDDLRWLATEGGGERLIEQFVDTTPLIKRGPDEEAGSRELDCLAWLKANKAEHKHWLAIDDMPMLFSPNCQHLYTVNPKCGLMQHDVERINDLIKKLTVKCFGGLDHKWEWAGQTLTNNRWQCEVCGQMKME